MVQCAWVDYWPWITGGSAALGALWLWGGRIVTLGQWFKNRYDGKVLSIMEEASRKARLEHPTMNIALMPFKVSELADELNRTHESVRKSLRRLDAKGKVQEVKKDEWCLGSRTQKELLDRVWATGEKGRFNSDRCGD